jgi:uncharacterized tellurite resistance protein B-like protein
MPDAKPVQAGFNRSSDEPVPIARPHPPAQGEGIRPPTFHSLFSSLTEKLSAALHSDTRPRKNDVVFYGADELVDIGRGPIRGSLVYATGKKFPSVYDASLIELPLPVCSRGIAPERLPYWPCYHDATSRQRAAYLDWIYGGRRDPKVELGYVFIFFYGLERRILVDEKDHELIAEELLRLLPIYGASRSFANYAGALLWLTIYLGGERGLLSKNVVDRAINATPRWGEDLLRYCLGYFSRRALAWPVELLYEVAARDERAIKSVVVRRQSEKFKTLFANRLRQPYPDGYWCQPSSRERKLEYRPASATLVALKAIESKTIPQFSLSGKKLTPLINLWNECVSQLKAYDRASHGGTIEIPTAEAYESLPSELRSGDHPEAHLWEEVIKIHADDHGWPVVKIGELAALKKYASRARLTKKQSASLVKTADALHLAIEPDTRITNKNYQWDECVAVYRDTPDNTSEKELDAFRTASILLQLGLSIAQADNDIADEELSQIAERLDQQFEFGESVSKRLKALQYLLTTKRNADISIARTLEKTMSLAARRAVGDYLLMIAGADQVICAEERKVLRRAYRGLGIPAHELEKKLAAFDAANVVRDHLQKSDSSDVTVLPALDLERIRAIREETSRVQELLHSVLCQVEQNADASILQEMVEANQPASIESFGRANSIATDQPLVEALAVAKYGSSTAAIVDSSAFSGLTDRYQSFCKLLITRDRWNKDELRAAARQYGLMLNAAFEAINEWSTEYLGDWLIDDTKSDIVVQIQLLGAR